MDNGEKDLIGPLLVEKTEENGSSSHWHEDREAQQDQEARTLYSATSYKAPAIVLGFSFLESLAFNGVGINLVMYLQTVLHGSNSSNAANASAWGGTSYLTPLICGLLADTYWGYYRTIIISTILYLLGMAIITCSASVPFLKPAPCEGNSCPVATGVQQLVFFSGLYLLALGSGGTRSALLPFGADQFDDENPVEREKKWSFFSWFYVCSMLGVLIAGTIIVWIQQNVDWALGFGIATFCMALASGGFFLGTPSYKSRMPNGSPLKSLLQVLVASLRKMHLKVPIDGSLLCEVIEKDKLQHQRLAHTGEFRFLDKAAITLDSDWTDGGTYDSWRLCTITQVEELKILIRFVPIWVTSIIYSAACTQMNSTFIQQGSSMYTRILSFSIPPASLSAFGVICVVVWVFIYKMIIAPVCIRCLGNVTGLSQLQRMGIGRFTMIISMLTAGYVESRRLASVKAGGNLSIAWQLPQYFIISGSEVFSYITQLEFFYGQAPESMRSICTSFALLSTALGNFLSSFLVTIVAILTTTGGSPGWIPDDLNKGHLDYYFYSLGGLCALNFLLYVAIARKYTLKKVVLTS